MVSERGFNTCFFGVASPLVFLIVALCFALPTPPADLKLGSNTTIWLNFTRTGLTVGGNITVHYTNPKEIVDVFFKNISVSISYKVKEHSTTEFLASTFLPSIYVETGLNGNYTTPIHIDVGTVDNTVGFGSGLVDFSLSLSASTCFFGLFHSKKGFIQVVCYPLIAHVSTIATINATYVLLAALPC